MIEAECFGGPKDGKKMPVEFGRAPKLVPYVTVESSGVAWPSQSLVMNYAKYRLAYRVDDHGCRADYFWIADES